MSKNIPASRQELIEYCLRRLGYPVISINVDEEQVNDLLEDAVQFFTEYNTEGTEKLYLKHRVTQDDIDRQSTPVIHTSNDISFNNNATTINPTLPDTIVDSVVSFTDLGFRRGSSIQITGSASNDGTYTIASVLGGTITLTTHNKLITEAAGSNITIEAISLDAGGFIDIPEEVLQVTRIFRFASDNLTSGDFNIQYQFMLNNVFDLARGGMIEYNTTRSYLKMMEDMFTGDKSIRFKRYHNKLYIDINWKKQLFVNDYLIVECYRKLEADSYTGIYNDIFLKRYFTALVKKQWGNNMKKFSGVSLPGGTTMEGAAIYNEAQEEIEKLEQEVSSKYEGPLEFHMG